MSGPRATMHHLDDWQWETVDDAYQMSGFMQACTTCHLQPASKMRTQCPSFPLSSMQILVQWHVRFDGNSQL